jgi:hypothetical protein
MKVQSPFLASLAVECAQGAGATSIDATVYALMATHVTEIINAADSDEEALLSLAASVVMLLAENFELQRRVLK